MNNEDTNHHPDTNGNGKPAVQIPNGTHSALGHSRNGKVARLPFEIRKQVNELLRGGCLYSDVCQKLSDLGYPGISVGNISNWKHGGFVDWLLEEQQLEARLALPAALEHCTRSAGIGRLQHVAIGLAAAHLSEIMHKFDHDRALDVLYRKPHLFPGYVGAIASLGRCTADLAKAFDLTQNREATIRAQLKSPAPPTAETPLIDESENPSDVPTEPDSAGNLNEPVADCIDSNRLQPNPTNYR